MDTWFARRPACEPRPRDDVWLSLAHAGRQGHVVAAFVHEGRTMLAEFAERRAGHCSPIASHAPARLRTVPARLRTVMEIVGWHLLCGHPLGDVA
jgi:hypothetical protein